MCGLKNSCARCKACIRKNGKLSLPKEISTFNGRKRNFQYDFESIQNETKSI